MEKKKFNEIELKELEKAVGAGGIDNGILDQLLAAGLSFSVIIIVITLLLKGLESGRIQEAVKYIEKVKSEHPDWTNDQIVGFIRKELGF